jgi:hypothetical protein
VSPAGAAALAIVLGLVGPLFVGDFGWQQRAALAVVLFCGALAVGARVEIPRSARNDMAAVAGALVLLLMTLPVAATREAAARRESERRTGERLVALSEPARAVAHLETAEAREEAAAVHVQLAEADVARGLSAEGYADAGAHLERALMLATTPAAERLDQAVKAVRFADIIWNQYDWPRTIAELKKAQAARPDLPGLKEKLEAAEASYRAAGR